MQERARTGPPIAATAGPAPIRLRVAGAAGLAGLLAACATPPVTIDTQETFGSTTTYSRTYAAVDTQTCEAARRALLSQGYVIGMATAEQVRGRKSFQPAADAHAEVEFTVVCAKEGHAGRRTIAFVNAVQESFTLRKSNNSASVGVSPFGSLSLPFSGSEEALVKVGSLTITSAPFYERFFQLVERYLAGDSGQAMLMPTAPVALPSPASASAPAPAPVAPTASAARPAS
jgi:hypothetical protein